MTELEPFTLTTPGQSGFVATPFAAGEASGDFQPLVAPTLASASFVIGLIGGARPEELAPVLPTPSADEV
ncbi:MAG: hypothetical protein WCP21_23925, partial [Armatimonadota bacterium]